MTDEARARGTITDMLASWMGGDRKAGDRLFSALYQELRILARRQLRHRHGDGTLDTTGLIHEAYLKLVDASRMKVNDRGHFLALASRVMRQIVVDYARRRNAAKRGGDVVRVAPDASAIPIGSNSEDLLALDRALERLEAVDPRAARLVELRYFGGMSLEETAAALQVSIGTVKREWERTRAFLYDQMARGRPA